MIKRFWIFIPLFIFTLGLNSCSSQQQQEESTAVVRGTLTVADSVDATGNYSGISLTIIKKDSANVDADTLFHSVTDSSGEFSGIARFPDKALYQAFVSRNNNRIGELGIILAEGDTVSVSATLPDVSGTAEISSREHNALRILRNVNRQFNRVRQFVLTGNVSQDSIGILTDQWSNLYWEIYNDYNGTLASRIAATESVRLLRGRKDSLMMSRIRNLHDQDELVSIAYTYGVEYLAESRGLDAALSYLDSLQILTDQETMSMNIHREKVKLLFDSARVEDARAELEMFKSEYPESKEARVWADDIGYDLENLAPGDSIPSFSFSVADSIISNRTLLGKPYLVEITSLTNQLYQEQYDRTTVIFSLYQNTGLEIVTLPLDENQVTVDGFFEERQKLWPVADAKSFDREDLIERFNVQFIPTRFLVDSKGKIVRKYVGREFEDIIRGLQSITNRTQSEK